MGIIDADSLRFARMPVCGARFARVRTNCPPHTSFILPLTPLTNLRR